MPVMGRRMALRGIWIGHRSMRWADSDGYCMDSCRYARSERLATGSTRGAGRSVVDQSGIEPPTSSLRTTRSPS